MQLIKSSFSECTHWRQKHNCIGRNAFWDNLFKASCLGQSFSNSKFSSELSELTENTQPSFVQVKHPILQNISQLQNGVKITEEGYRQRNNLQRVSATDFSLNYLLRHLLFQLLRHGILNRFPELLFSQSYSYMFAAQAFRLLFHI